MKSDESSFTAGPLGPAGLGQGWTEKLPGDPGEAEAQPHVAETQGCGAGSKPGAHLTGAFDPDERALMLRIARQTLSGVALMGIVPELPEEGVTPRLLQKRGCFVTLTRHGALRGCMGSLLPQEPLYRAIINNARCAATRDPRFPPVRRDEVDEIRIEISVLSELQPLDFTSPEELVSKLQANLDGVVLRIGGAMATFLPQVWAQLPRKEDFLNHLATKAGCDAAAWRGGESSVSTYRVEAFEEPPQVLHRN